MTLEATEEGASTTAPKTTTTAPKSSSAGTPHSETEVELQEVDFSALTDFVENDGEVETPPVEQVAEEESISDEETPPEETPEPVEAQSAEEPEEAVEPEVKAEPEKKETPVVEEPVQPEVKVPTEEELQGMYTEHREKTLPKFEEMLQLTEEEAAALDEQPSKVMPKLAARLMYDTMLSTYNAVMAAIPSPVNRLIQATRHAEEAEREFYGEWPELQDKKYAPVIGSAIQAFRAANPRADRQTVIKQAGVMAMLQLGLDPVNRAGKQPAAPPAPKKQPPKPVGGRNTTQTAPPNRGRNEPENIFAGLAEAFEADNG